MTRITAGLLAACLSISLPAFAQHETHQQAATVQGWAWTLGARAFLDVNLQQRRFRDFHVVEAQNWLMVGGTRPLRRARVSFHTMFSAEDATLGRYGSPQVFQTGETFEGAALVDYQHPHDVVMAASVRFDMPVGASKWRAWIEGGPVGAPAFGPVAFMHRASAAFNPTAPLSHHHLDSLHVTHDVVTLGIARSSFAVDVSAFHGREPDEDRLRVETGPIDSVSARARWQRAKWDVQMSAAAVKSPDPTEFTDSRRFSLSASYLDDDRAKPIAIMVAAGVMREPALDVTSPAVLAEATLQLSPRTHAYGRAEWLAADILTRGGYDPPGFAHPHTLSRIAALTVGAAREIGASPAGMWSWGGDVTIYARDQNLADSYGTPVSAHVFLRFHWTR